MATEKKKNTTNEKPKTQTSKGKKARSKNEIIFILNPLKQQENRNMVTV